MVGGAPLPWRLGRQFTERTGLRVERGYGLTEASPGVTTTVGGEILGPFHVGRPLPGVDVRVGDGLDPSEPGEIAVRGANLFSGYWPDGTGGPDEDGWFATGDIGFQTDGELFLVDRTREIVSVSGFTVYPSEIEQSIRQLAEVEAVAVVGRSTAEVGRRPAMAWWRSWPVRASPRIWSATSAGPGCPCSSAPPRCGSSTIFPAG